MISASSAAIGLRQLAVHVEMQVKQAAQALEGGRMGWPQTSSLLSMT
jgi:hypothetical protein